MTEHLEWVEEEGVLTPKVPGRRVAWAAQPGAQREFLTSPCPEVLLEGNRGGGKTDALLMDFGQHVGTGFGVEWKGILFRRTFKQLADVIEKTKKWFPQIWPGSTYNASDYRWTWPTGEKLFLRYMEREADYWNYHGWNVPWLGWEELTAWPDDRCYRVMISCWRTTCPGIRKKIRATTNPYGPGHNWVKHRFQLPTAPGLLVGPVIYEDNHPPRCSIRSRLDENQILMTADPEYINAITAAARSPAELKAWLEGDWNIVAGGMFDDVWNPLKHVVPPFDIPSSWRITRSFDWGSSAPFSVGWWAISDGSDLEIQGRTYSTVRGDVFRWREWYGSTGKPNEGLRMLAKDIAAGIVERELQWGIRHRVQPGPADSAIFNVENGMSIANDMMKPVRINGRKYKGPVWLPADKRPGSRKTGWEQMRRMLSSGVSRDGLPREDPGLFVVRDCTDFIRTVPVLPRDLDKDPDDVDTDAEDHIADETRYLVRHVGKGVRGGRVSGLPS